jgi:hypothetical protein
MPPIPSASPWTVWLVLLAAISSRAYGAFTRFVIAPRRSDLLLILFFRLLIEGQRAATLAKRNLATAGFAISCVGSNVV